MSLENFSINSSPRPLVSHPKIKYDPFLNSFAYREFLAFVEKKTVEAPVVSELRNTSKLLCRINCRYFH